MKRINITFLATCLLLNSEKRLLSDISGLLGIGTFNLKVEVEVVIPVIQTCIFSISCVVASPISQELDGMTIIVIRDLKFRNENY